MSKSWLQRLGARAASVSIDSALGNAPSPLAQVSVSRECALWRLLAECQEVASHVDDEKSFFSKIGKAFAHPAPFALLWLGVVSQKLDQIEVVAHSERANLSPIQHVVEHFSVHQSPPELIARAFRSRREVVLRHVSVDPLWQEFRSEAKTGEYDARLIVPILLMSGEVVGVIDLYAVESDAFENAEVELLARVASAIATSVSRFRTLAKRKSLEQRNLEKLGRYDVVLRGALEGFCVFDSEGRIVDANAAYSRIVGYTRQELLQMKLRDLELSANPQGDPDSNGASSTGIDRFEARHRTKDGRILELEGSACFTPFDGRNFFSCFYRDVTARRRAEEDLRIFKSVIDSSAEAIGIADSDFRICYVNPAHQALFGYSIEQLQGKSPDDLYVVPLSEAQKESVQDCSRAMADWVIDAKDKSGRVFALQHRGGVVPDITGRPKYFFCLMQEATGRLAAERALRESERRLRALFDNASVGIVIEKKRNSVQLNRAMRKLVGVNEEWLSDRSLADFIAPIDRPELSDRYAQLARGPQTAVAFESRLLRSDKTEAICKISICGEPQADGELEYVFAIVEDLTAKRRAEDSVEAASRLEATATLAGGIAHGINNLMAVVVGNSELLRTEMEPLSDGAAMLQDIYSSGQRAADLSQQLVAFARGGKYRPEPLSLNSVVEQSLQLNALTIPAPIHLELDLDPMLNEVQADGSQMRQVLANLCANAVEASGNLGEIRISTENVLVDQSLAAEVPGMATGHYVVLSVTDCGCGISPEVRERLFEPFFTTKFQGRGLGLAAVWGIMKNHGGHILVQTNQPKGTVFRLFLPAIRVSASCIRPSFAEAMRGAETILLVDDEAIVLGVTRRLLTRLGYNVLSAESGAEALELAKSYPKPIELAIVDMVMPKMAGEQLCPLLQQIRPKIKLIICSGYQLESSNCLADLGVGAFVQKPFGVEHLAAEIRRVLDFS